LFWLVFLDILLVLSWPVFCLLLIDSLLLLAFLGRQLLYLDIHHCLSLMLFVCNRNGQWFISIGYLVSFECLLTYLWSLWLGYLWERVIIQMIWVQAYLL
jgi:hypothetical protein